VKKASVIIIALTALAVFACTIPSAFEIKGSQSAKFSANMDFSEMFSGSVLDSFNSDDENFKILSCANSKYMTFIIYLPLFDEVIDSALDDAVYGLLPSDGIYKISGDKQMASGSSSAVSLGGTEDYLAGFDFNSVKSQLYISGSDIAEYLSITIGIDGDSFSIKKSGGFVFTGSGFDEEKWKNFSDEEWEALSDPNKGGKEIDLTKAMKNSAALAFDYNVIMEDGMEIPIGITGNENSIKAELVIWLPMEFIASAEDGGVLIFPNDFMGGENDLFFREEAGTGDDSITKIIKKLNIDIEMNKSPFDGALLVINSTGGLEITNELSGGSISFGISEENMAKLNEPEYFPFIPKFNIYFKKDEIMAIPRDFRITYICLNADFEYAYYFRQGKK